MNSVVKTVQKQSKPLQSRRSLMLKSRVKSPPLIHRIGDAINFSFWSSLGGRSQNLEFWRTRIQYLAGWGGCNILGEGKNAKLLNPNPASQAPKRALPDKIIRSNGKHQPVAPKSAPHGG